MPTEVPDSGVLAIMAGFLTTIYVGITGHTYSRVGKLESKIDKSRDHSEEIYVTRDTFEAHMDAIQQANLANAKFTDANTRANEELFRLMNTKQDKT